MFKQKIEYLDFNGETRTEDFYFHLSTPEVVRIEAELGEPIAAYAQKVADQKELAPLLAFMEKMILSAYGRKTTDGKSFYKSKDLREEFEYSQAYAEFFEMLIKDPALARKFGEGVADNGKRKNQVQPVTIDKQ